MSSKYKGSRFGSITNFQAGSTSDSEQQYGGDLFYFHCQADDELSVINDLGQTVSYKAAVGGWQPVAVKQIKTTDTTIADTDYFLIGR